MDLPLAATATACTWLTAKSVISGMQSIARQPRPLRIPNLLVVTATEMQKEEKKPTLCELQLVKKQQERERLRREAIRSQWIEYWEITG